MLFIMPGADIPARADILILIYLLLLMMPSLDSIAENASCRSIFFTPHSIYCHALFASRHLKILNASHAKASHALAQNFSQSLLISLLAAYKTSFLKEASFGRHCFAGKRDIDAAS